MFENVIKKTVSPFLFTRPLLLLLLLLLETARSWCCANEVLIAFCEHEYKHMFISNQSMRDFCILKVLLQVPILPLHEGDWTESSTTELSQCFAYLRVLAGIVMQSI